MNRRAFLLGTGAVLAFPAHSGAPSAKALNANGSRNPSFAQPSTPPSADIAFTCVGPNKIFRFIDWADLERGFTLKGGPWGTAFRLVEREGKPGIEIIQGTPSHPIASGMMFGAIA